MAVFDEHSCTEPVHQCSGRRGLWSSFLLPAPGSRGADLPWTAPQLRHWMSLPVPGHTSVLVLYTTSVVLLAVLVLRSSGIQWNSWGSEAARGSRRDGQCLPPPECLGLPMAPASSPVYTSRQKFRGEGSAHQASGPHTSYHGN